MPIGSLDDAPLEAAVAEPIGDDGTFTLAACGVAACWAPVSANCGSPGRGCRIASICSTATTIRHLVDSLPEVGLTSWSPRSRTVEVSGAHGPFMLVLAEAAGQAWTASVDGVELDGIGGERYATAWPMDLSGDAVVDLHYGPGVGRTWPWR